MSRDWQLPRKFAPVAAQKEAPKEKAAPKIQWQPSLESAIKESKRSGKPIFVDFHATWCPSCKMMEKQTFPDAKVIAESQKWVMLKIDTDKQPDLAIKYSVSSLPTLAALRADGQPITGAVGFMDAAEFIKFLRFAEREVAKHK